jgi:hypothetical protein
MSAPAKENFAAPRCCASPLRSTRVVLESRQQPVPPALVAQEQVLHMAARQLAAQALGILDRAQRRMSRCRAGDAERFEMGEQFVGGHEDSLLDQAGR